MVRVDRTGFAIQVGAKVIVHFCRRTFRTFAALAKHFSISETGTAYFAYEYAGIPGTLLCGYLSDLAFKGKRGPVIIIYMVAVALAILLYWTSGSLIAKTIALILIGFLIYGPVMLIGVHALDLVPKKAAGTAAGFTGLFGYAGGALFANIAMGFVVDHFGWAGGFVVLLLSCVLSILFMAYAWRAENKLLREAKH